jgi:hypothetical protein
MTPAERTIACTDENSFYKNKVEKGYAYLIKEGNRLKKLYGIKYFDLTMVFADNDEILYADPCCHLNETGNRYIAEFIGKIINDHFESGTRRE